MVTTRPPKTIVKPTALGPVANTDTKLLIYGLFQKGRVLAQDGMQTTRPRFTRPLTAMAMTNSANGWIGVLMTADSTSIANQA